MSGLQILFGFNGRIRRSVYWGGLLLINVLTLIYWFAVGNLANVARGNNIAEGSSSPSGTVEFLAGILVLAGWAAAIWSGLAISIKRAHDRGYAGAVAFVAMIPIVGWLWALIDLGCIEGDAGKNRYGPSPKARSRSIPPSDIFAVTQPPVGNVAPPVSRTATDPSDDALYATVAQEIEKNDVDQGLWTRLLVENDGDEQKTKIAYIKARVIALKARGQAGLPTPSNSSASVPITPPPATVAPPESSLERWPSIQIPVEQKIVYPTVPLTVDAPESRAPYPAARTRSSYRKSDDQGLMTVVILVAVILLLLVFLIFKSPIMSQRVV